MNTAGRGVILAIAAVVLGAVILGKGFDDPSALGTGDSAQPTPTATASSDDGGGDDTTDDAAGTDDDSGTDGSSDDGTDGSTDGGAPTATPLADGGVLHQPTEVRIMVANGTNESGLAGRISGELVAAAGYVELSPANSLNQGSVAETTVYYTEGYQGDAASIAESLGFSRIAAMPNPPPVADLLEADVLIELGSDIVPG